MHIRKWLLIVFVVAGAAVGAVSASLLAKGEPPRRQPQSAERVAERLQGTGEGELDAAELAQVVESLVQVLDEEIAERRILADQLEQTRIEMSDLQQNLRVRVEEAFDMNPDTDRSASENGRSRRASEDNGVDSVFLPQGSQRMRSIICDAARLKIRCCKSISTTGPDARDGSVRRAMPRKWPNCRLAAIPFVANWATLPMTVTCMRPASRTELRSRPLSRRRRPKRRCFGRAISSCSMAARESTRHNN
jgi:hypothetical protein